MPDFIKDITSLYWWIAVVVVGILINLVSSYLKPKIDLFIARYSSSKQTKIKKRQEWRIQKIERLKSNDIEKVLLHMQINKNYLRSIIFLLFGIIFYSVPNIINGLTSTTILTIENHPIAILLGYSFGSLLIMLAYYTWFIAIKLSDLLNEVHKHY